VRNKGIRWKNSPDSPPLIHILNRMHYNLTHNIERIFCCAFPDTCTSFPVLLLHVIDLTILFVSFSVIYHLSIHVTVMLIRITFYILYVTDMLYWIYVRCYIDYLYWMMYGRHDTVHDAIHDTVHDGINVLMLYWMFLFYFYCYYVWICYFNVVCLYYD